MPSQESRQHLPVLPPGYEYLKRISAGAQGVVWLVRNTNMGKPGRHEAIKILCPMNSPHTYNKLNMQRFCQEISTLATLSHPNIVTIYCAKPDDVYFIMEYLPGGSFAQMLNEPDLSLFKAVEYVAQIAEGLHFAHTKGLVHRDLKPQNILFSSSLIPKITDFGLAKVFEHNDDATHSCVSLGTPHYMAPEQWEDSKTVDHRCDIWALGVMLYQILTKQLPFIGKNGANLMYSVLNTPITPPHKIVSNLPKLGILLEPVCMRSLEKVREKRYEDAQEMAYILKEILKRCPPTAEERLRQETLEKKTTRRFAKYEDELHSTNILEISEKIKPTTDFRSSDEEGLHTTNVMEVSRNKDHTTSFRDIKLEPGFQNREKSSLSFQDEKPSNKNVEQAREVGPSEGASVSFFEKIQEKKQLILTCAALFIIFCVYLKLKPPSLSSLRDDIAYGDENTQLASFKILKNRKDHNEKYLEILILALNSEYDKVQSQAAILLKKLASSKLRSEMIEKLIVVSQNKKDEMGEIVYNKRAQVLALEVLGEIEAQKAEEKIYLIARSSKFSVKIRKAAVDSLLIINPKYKKKYSWFEGEWCMHSSLRRKGYVKVGNRWCRLNEIGKNMQEEARFKILDTLTRILKLENVEYDVQSKIQALEILGKMKAKEAEDAIYTLIAKKGVDKKLRQVAIKNLLLIAPDYSKDYAYQGGLWQTTKSLTQKGYMKINNQWVHYRRFLEQAEKQYREAKKYQSRQERFRRSWKEELLKKNFDQKALEVWAKNLDLYKNCVNILPMMGEHIRHSATFEEKVFRETLGLLQELESTLQNLPKIKSYLIRSKLDHFYLQAAKWKWTTTKYLDQIENLQKKNKKNLDLLLQKIASSY